MLLMLVSCKHLLISFLVGRAGGGKDKDKINELVTEGLSPELASLQYSVLKACKANSIKFPITRHDFVLICKSLNLRCTTRQAIEAVLVSRGKSLEQANPEDFDIVKMLEYLQY